MRECWSEIWDVLKPLVDAPFHGGPSTWMEDIELHINRKGFTEETHFTVAYSPVPDETVPSGIGGVLATVHEITEKVVAERRVVILRDLAARVGDAKTPEEACTNAVEVLSKHEKDLPFALLYLLNSEKRSVVLSAVTGVLPGLQISRPQFALDDTTNVWPFSRVIDTNETECQRRNKTAAFPPVL